MRRRFVQHNKRHAGRKSKPRKTYFYSRKHDDATSLPKNEVAQGEGRAFLCLAWPARLQHTTVQKNFLHYWYLLNCDIDTRRAVAAVVPCRVYLQEAPSPYLGSIIPFSSFVLTTDTSPIASKNSFNASGVKHCNQKGATQRTSCILSSQQKHAAAAPS